MRGLTNQVIRRLERIEGDILAERHARVDDLALLVDLIAAGWQSVDERLAKLEERLHARAARSSTASRNVRPGLSSPRPAETSTKRLPAAGLAVELEPAAERESELARDREAETRAAAVPATRTAGRSAPASPARSRPVSATATLTSPFCAPSAEVDATARGRPMERVGEQVRDDLQHPVAVGDEHRSLAELQVVLDPAGPRLLGERRVGALAEAPHVDLLAQEREAARVELGEVEDVTDEPLEPHRLLATTSSERPRDAFVLEDALAQRRHVAADRGQRRPQLVRDRHEEVAGELLRLRQPRGHLVEPSRRAARPRCPRCAPARATS